MNEEPLISVVLPTYNVAQYLENIAAQANNFRKHFFYQKFGYFTKST
jgi:glycosyltransferase involved in cell wall biosynthesis